MTERRVLISGAGIAGTSLAYWLARCGYRPTVVERAPDLRTGGSPVDVRGQSLEVAERMGVLGEIRAAHTDIRNLSIVDDRGAVGARVPMTAFGAAGDIETMRGDLVRILHRAGERDTEYLFGDTITALDQDEDGVTASFAHAGPRRFELVLGADGLHSAVRGLVFGAQEDHLHHLGCTVGVATVAREFGRDREVLLYNVPGKAVGVYRSGNHDHARVIFLSREPAPRYDHRDQAAQRELLAENFTGLGWRTPELLQAMRGSPEFFFDTVSQVRMPEWSRGRIGLLGDAAYCPALLSGTGSGLAMVGAYVLAGELAACGDPVRALRGYEQVLRAEVRRGQSRAGYGGGMLVPASRTGIRARNLAARFLAPLAKLGSSRKRSAPLPEYPIPERLA
ncbi:FAD-dependent monooxygenase [Sciscionella sediminilitoris]|uniref:FAD-dependent monooxygenase n=1 Tax=Sciscionella sediminilitoris TaxID=1445613 RepID=UPI0004DF179B|nr:FAD-dependent monooxygenase [Sciscionella sp. SE31]